MPAGVRFVAVFRSWLHWVVLTFVALAPDGASAGERFHHHRLIDRVVVFGDSLSDSGNAFALNGGVFVAPPDYGMGGVDPVTGKASNYAVGGARANATGIAPHLSLQVGSFLLASGGSAPSDALYVVEIGGNDIRDALIAPIPGDVIAGAVASVMQNIGALYEAGARKFLVWNAPDLGSTPAFQRLDQVPTLAGIANAATVLSAAYKNLLETQLSLLESDPNFEQIDIVRFDVFEKLHKIQENPRAFGLREAKLPCIQPNVPEFGAISSPPYRCKHPEDYFFTDGIHPTRAGHRVIAFLVAKELLSALVLDD